MPISCTNACLLPTLVVQCTHAHCKSKCMPVTNVNAFPRGYPRPPHAHCKSKCTSQTCLKRECMPVANLGCLMHACLPHVLKPSNMPVSCANACPLPTLAVKCTHVHARRKDKPVSNTKHACCKVWLSNARIPIANECDSNPSLVVLGLRTPCPSYAQVVSNRRKCSAHPVRRRATTGSVLRQRSRSTQRT